MDINNLSNFLSSIQIVSISKALVLVAIGLPTIIISAKWVRKIITKKYSAQHGLIFSKAIHYIGLATIFLTAFHELGFSLTPLLGAAGIVGIALGFASQTSVSNIISGVFLVAEQPFVIGDVISIGDTTGEVLSIDTLSVKLRTFDNKFVRIPNENIIKSQVTNITHFPIRRLDLKIGIAYKEDVGTVREILLDVAQKNPLALQEPEPIVIFSGFGNSSIDLLFVNWAIKEDYLKLKNSLQEEIKVRFDQEGIEIPFPHISLYTGSATTPFPVKNIKEKK